MLNFNIASIFGQALKINPQERWTAAELASTSLFEAAAPATVDLSRLAQTIEDTNQTAYRIESKVDKLYDLVSLLVDKFETLLLQSIGGGADFKSCLDCLHSVLESQFDKLRSELSFDLSSFRNTILESVASIGVDFSRQLSDSLAELMDTQNHADTSSQQETLQEIKLLVTDMRAQLGEVETLRRDVASLLSLVQTQEMRLNRVPHTFLAVVSTDADANIVPGNLQTMTKFSRLKGFFKEKKNKISQVLWKLVRIRFYCPVTMKFVQCGLDGGGYVLRVPSDALRAMVPAITFGFWLVKTALATQGFGGLMPIPDLNAMLPDINIESLVKYGAQIEQLSDQHFAPEDILKNLKDGIPGDPEAIDVNSVQWLWQLMKKAEGQEDNSYPEWKPQRTGLVLTRGPSAEDWAWVCPEAAGEYSEHGRAAFSLDSCVYSSFA